MIITKQNDKYITVALRNISKDDNVAWGVDTEGNFVAMIPESVDLAKLEAEVAEVKPTIDLEEMRFYRDIKLAETDWSQAQDVPEATKLKWQDYRQALRDITNTYSSLEEVVWPEKPE